ncbi:hypothetical protein [Acidobacterium sp. S8]|uniref:hypothetical protein n=1 Tax=Acidobacterium sp. S8 TaxID=1641854 RepID=UPI00131E0BEF|nr:hypothetical protein [Acidobacterium sp. S8]
MPATNVSGADTPPAKDLPDEWVLTPILQQDCDLGSGGARKPGTTPEAARGRGEHASKFEDPE